MKIPKDLEGCFDALNRELGEVSIEGIKKMTEDAFVAATHHGLGKNLRNLWGLWETSELVQYFHAMGIHHPDDMSGIILRSYHRRLMDKPLDLERQVQFYKDFWGKVKNGSN